MLDASLQILVGHQTTLACVGRCDRAWLVTGKETLISAIVPTILGIVLAIITGTDWSKV